LYVGIRILLFFNRFNPENKEKRPKKSEKSEKKLFVAQNPINPMGQVGFLRGGEG
jgi:hypothetical protein